MKLYYTPRSPYARKVLMVAYQKGVFEQIERITVVLADKAGDWIDANPLGKVPTLVTDTGEAIYDSRVIAGYLDTLNNTSPVLPGEAMERVRIRRIESLADGVTDAAVGIFRESLRKPEKQSLGVVGYQKETAKRGLIALQNDLPRLNDGMHLGSIAAGVAIAFTARIAQDVLDECEIGDLLAWYRELETAPAMQATTPEALA